MQRRRHPEGNNDEKQGNQPPTDNRPSITKNRLAVGWWLVALLHRISLRGGMETTISRIVRESQGKKKGEDPGESHHGIKTSSTTSRCSRTASSHGVAGEHQPRLRQPIRGRVNSLNHLKTKKYFYFAVNVSDDGTPGIEHLLPTFASHQPSSVRARSCVSSSSVNQSVHRTFARAGCPHLRFE
jgi:hypothetical protein